MVSFLFQGYVTAHFAQTCMHGYPFKGNQIVRMQCADVVEKICPQAKGENIIAHGMLNTFPHFF